MAMNGLVAASLFAGLGAGPARAQSPSTLPPPEVSFRYEQVLPASAFAPRGLVVHVEIPAGWHINADTTLDEFLVPTTLEVATDGPVAFGKPKFPAPERVRSDAVGGDMLLLSGAFDIEVPVRRKPVPGAKAPVAKDSPKPPTRVTLRYQACDHATCFPPKAVTIER
jgi:hypothetical protein